MANLGRKPLPRLMSLEASYEQTGISVKPDLRYDLVCDYLKASPSYEAVMRKLAKQKSPYPLPKDFKDVAQVVSDFGPIYKMREADWWGEIGMRLYGISAPLPKVNVVGVLDSTKKQLINEWAGVNSVVAELPLNLTLPQALKQLRKQLEGYGFSADLPKQVAPLYQLSNSKLRIDTLQNGLTALRLYKKDVPLWKIGNHLRLIPAQSFIESEAGDILEAELADRKELLSIAASRLIRCASLVAENAARGRFPSDKNFTEAITTPYKRKAGRPTGTKKSK
ncbi:hypothetical protein [Polynucleobacter corsicus]|uniref:hypothetical protein n=1 Tax=Polynucleobacter corsicus TaxID=2081042 RepID=UPI001BFD1B27|nr:hypothetical protein [Polynucleobacter corsicus]QWE18666.1 hypothetical protein C2747_10370 [Polynucleobacter corsicus]